MTTNFGVCLEELFKEFNLSRPNRLTVLLDKCEIGGNFKTELMSMVISSPRQHGLTTSIRNVYGNLPTMYVVPNVSELVTMTKMSSGVSNTILHTTSDNGRVEGLYLSGTYVGYIESMVKSGNVPRVIFTGMLRELERGLKRHRIVNAIMDAVPGVYPDVLFLG